LTAICEENVFEKAIASRFKIYMKKPFEPEELIVEISRLLKDSYKNIPH